MTAVIGVWGLPAKAWWNSPDDPNIRLLKADSARCPVLGRARRDGRLCEDGRRSTDRLKAQHGREPQSGHAIDERYKPKQTPEEPASAGHAR